MITSISHFIYAILSLVIAAGLLGSYLRSDIKVRKIKRFAIFFILFAFYQLFFSYFLFFDNLYFAAWSYNIAIVISFAMLAFIVSIILSIGKVEKVNRKMVYFAMFIVSLFVVGLQIYDFRTPIVREDGIVDWNANKLASRIAAFSSFMVALSWSYSLLVNISLFHGHPKKVKASMLALGGLFLGIGGLTAYHEYGKIITAVSHVSAYAGGLIFLLVFMVFDKEK